MSEVLSRVTVVCFAGSYLVALAAELCRLKFRQRFTEIVLAVFTVGGLLAHSIYLYFHAVAPQRTPLSSERDFYLVAAWVLAAVYLYLSWRRPHSVFGLFVLGLVLVLIAVAVLFASPEPYGRTEATHAWQLIHGLSILAATVSLFLGFIAGVLYLWQVRRLKRKRPPLRVVRLPSIEWLQRANIHAVWASVIMLGIGLVSGVLLNSIRPNERVSWHDPVVVATTVMFVWLVIVAVSSAVYRPIREGHKVAYLTVISFLFLLVVLISGLFLPTQHGAKGKQKERPQVHILHEKQVNVWDSDAQERPCLKLVQNNRQDGLNFRARHQAFGQTLGGCL